ncbi:protein PIGMENT DEFECTIVE 338, chloroplastic-like isoform X2 [Lotus japonicus]|uniref:protein PIGMENT DEFECTIVE 338, chloroplastic-like isoform X2 n=1 Tax=Lotus japonicus TaxID=34305 RepID=UPI002588F56B|nr:protein PIGMENT DEFECTIVE 338, chloroplastic-like isoform X2 [Lotus japonicus]
MKQRPIHVTVNRTKDAIDSLSLNGELFLGNELSQEAVDVRIPEQETLELLNKPSLVPIRNGSFPEIEVETEKASIEVKGDDGVLEVSEERDEMGVDENEEEEEGAKKVNNAEYYEPKPGDFVFGVVVSGNANRLNVNVGAELPGTLLTKEVLPLNSNEMEYLICDGNKKCEKNFMAHGRMGILKNDEDDDDAINGVMVVPVGNTVVEIGTILFAEVLGRTLTGRPLLSTRKLFRRIAWHRLRQIKQLNEPIMIRVTEWNISGLLTRIEGMRAFLPKAELVKRVNSFTELKENVGCCMYVQITEVDEAKNNVIVSEREAWEKLYLREGTLLEGTVKKVLPYGAQIRIGETNRCGLLHVSNITRGGVTSGSDILSVDEKVKVLVVKSAFPGKISLSIRDLESEPGLFLSNRERVFLEADMMAKKYKEKLPPALTSQQSKSVSNSALPFENEALYANWKWFKFEK